MEDLKKSYINAMRGVTSTVNIISAKEDDERHAMTATSVTSLSLDPPAMLVCVNKDASIHNIINYGSSFCINILSNRQKELAEVCSKSEEGEARFEGQLWKENDNFIYAKQSLSNIFCECSNLVEHSSHTIFIGNVTSVINSDEDCPLIYGSGKYLN